MSNEMRIICAQYLVPCSDPALANGLVAVLEKVIGWTAGSNSVNYINPETTTVIEATGTLALIQVGFTYPISHEQAETFHKLLRNLMTDLGETVAFLKERAEPTG